MRGDRDGEPKATMPGGVKLMDAAKVDALLPKVAVATVLLWLVLTASVYFSAPDENIVYLDGPEQFAAAVAFVVFAIGMVMSMLPFAIGIQSRKMSGVMIASFVNLGIALVTNGVLAFGPSVVYVDPVTKSRAFIVRYCEWAPLAGLQTFLSEAVDLPADRKDIRLPVMTSILQMFATSAGILGPMCPGPIPWIIVMIISFSSFLTIFTRVDKKWRVLRKQTFGPAASEAELRDRLQFAYKLILSCSVLWTSLVVLYFFNMGVHHFTSEDHPLRTSGLPMVLDTLFDLVGKLVYAWLIVHVHDAAFDEGGRARRRLKELQHMLSVLWESSSDAIMLAVRGRNGDVSVLLSPSYASLIGVTWGDKVTTQKALIVEMQESQCSSSLLDSSDRMGTSVRPTSVKNAYLVDADHPFDIKYNTTFPIAPNEHCISEAERLVRLSWHCSTDETTLLTRELAKCDGSIVKCEIKVTKRSDDEVVAVIQDVTKRYQLAAAEQRAAMEAISRQQDAQTVNRFVRHEVKNGLLASIELCDGLRTSLSLPPADDSVAQGAFDPKALQSRIVDLDAALHEILDTVLAEAMAREVIHEVYQPKLERLDVLATLSGAYYEERKKERFPILSTQGNLSYLLMDPQLLLYIHRNAVSNACKYGKPDGQVVTEVQYIEETQELEMNVINLPGSNHEELVAMGHEASDGVFRQGKRLHAQLEMHGKTLAVSSGDGAWIMQKCATTLGGVCSIRFDPDRTIFTFRCPTTQFTQASEAAAPWGDPCNFEVPEDSWAIAVDDSKIQRKLLSKLLTNAGFAEERQVLLGGTVEEVKNVGSLMRNVIVSNPESKVLILMDENLDICENGELAMLSGSSCLHEMLIGLGKDDEDRVLALVRSANDSGEDLDVYMSRSHGFFPKAPMKRDRIRGLLGELWYKRFYESGGSRFVSVDDMESARIEVEEALSTLGKLIEGGVTEARWPLIWEGLSGLNGKLIEYKWSPKIMPLVDLIKGMSREGGVPSEFERIWKIIQGTVSDVVIKGTPSSKGQKGALISSTDSVSSGVKVIA